MYKKLLVPIATGHDEKYKHAIEVAERLVSDDGKIILFHVVDELPGYVTAQIPKEALADTHSHMRNELDELSKTVKGNVEVDVISGHASRTILEYGEEFAEEVEAIDFQLQEFSD